MILFVTGDAHTAGAYATNDYKTAEEDPGHWELADLPHPDNYNVSWGVKLSDLLKTKYRTISVPHDNTDIINCTKEWLSEQTDEVFIIIGWNDSIDDNEIFNFHLWLKENNIKHIFFDTNTRIKMDYDFGNNYMEQTYSEYLKQKGHEPVITSDTYFPAGAHSEWAIYLLKHIAINKMI